MGKTVHPTHLERVVAWLKDHPGPNHRSEIAKAAKVPDNQVASVLALGHQRGLLHATGPNRRSGNYAYGAGPAPRDQAKAGTGTAVATTNGNGDGAHGTQVLPETLNFNVVGVLSDNRLVLEFKKTKDVFVAKRVDI